MLKKFILQQEFTRNIFTLITGTFIAQVITFASSPLLTRIYSPQDFGIFALYIAVVSIFSVMITGRYELAVMLPKTDREARRVMVISNILTIGLSLFFLIIIIAFHSSIINIAISNEKNIEYWIFLVPVSLMLSGGYQSFHYWFVRKKEYKILSKSKVFQSILTVIVSYGFGVFCHNGNGLIIGLIFGQCAAVCILMQNYFTQGISFKVCIKKMRVIMMRYSEFPKHSVPTAFLDGVSSSMPFYLISSFFSTQLLGLYSLAYRTLQVPSSVVGSAISQVFYQKFCELDKNPLIQANLLFGIWKRLFLIGIIPFTILFFYGQELFGFIFGERWSEAGHIASVLSPMLFVAFISSPTSTAIIALNMQKMSVYFGVTVLIYRCFSLLMGYYYSDFLLGLKVFIILEIIQIGLYNFFIIRKLKGLK